MLYWSQKPYNITDKIIEMFSSDGSTIMDPFMGSGVTLLESLNKKFDMGVFLSGFFGNAVLAMLLAYLGQRLNVDIYLAAIFVFVSRMFNNLGIIRRFYLEKFRKNKTEDVKNQ